MGSYTYEKEFVTVGPWGGRGGRHWDDGVLDSIREIVITYGSVIDSIMFLYEKHGNVYTSNKHGGNGGDLTKKVKLNHPEEYLLAMRGYYGPKFGHESSVILSLTFISNVRAYGPFGVEQGHSFTLQMFGGQILGFYGRDGGYLDSIGAYVKHIICPHNPSHSLKCPKRSGCCTVIEGNIGDKYDVLAIKLPENSSTDNSSIPAEVSNQILASDKNNHTQKRSGALGGIVSYGPWGGNGGTVFDDGKSFTGIKQIVLSTYMGHIIGIRLLYEQNGKSVWGCYHGDSGSCYPSDKIDLDYPNEILTKISGYHDLTMIDRPAVIRSLTFHTSKGKNYGPYGYGYKLGVPFSSNSNEGTIVGIHGRTDGEFLVAIGVHLKKGNLNAIGSSSDPDV